MEVVALGRLPQVAEDLGLEQLRLPLRLPLLQLALRRLDLGLVPQLLPRVALGRHLLLHLPLGDLDPLRLEEDLAQVLPDPEHRWLWCCWHYGKATCCAYSCHRRIWFRGAKPPTALLRYGGRKAKPPCSYYGG